MMLDARPDRLDLRDREYRPTLASLPVEFPTKQMIDELLPSYRKCDFVLNQGNEGACTGFGLAATINYLMWRDYLEKNKFPKLNTCPIELRGKRVSMRMLYHMARIYDEWDGEDYSGSSCRGAMKGWHRHGVCTLKNWKYWEDEKIIGKVNFIPPEKKWAEDALQNTLGAYYRVNHDSVADMQAAIHEVGAIYCSASVHTGWQFGEKKEFTELPLIQRGEKKGGHAFCIVGYNQEGFIVQNSWGEAWGWNGFALLSYADWVENGKDAWVVSRGVPVKVKKAPVMFANNALRDTACKSQFKVGSAGGYEYDNESVKPWSEEQAYQHALVIANNGRPKHTSLATENQDASAEFICKGENIKKWLNKSPKNRKIVVYAHGGLTCEEDAINRARIMAPYFKENGIYPVFLVWKTGALETIKNMLNDAIDSILKGDPSIQDPDEGIGEWLTDKSDSAIESIIKTLRGKSLWTEMKENAKLASSSSAAGVKGEKGAMVILADALKELKESFPDIEIHAIGHSAGSIILGHWMKRLRTSELKLESLSLYAPACTIEFANKKIIKACDDSILNKNKIFIHNMDVEREKADNTAGIYRKSLLYLVSRAFEGMHKMPILGLEEAWNLNKYQKGKSGGFNFAQKNKAKKWTEFFGESENHISYDREDHPIRVNKNHDVEDLSHGSFDNDINVMEFTIQKILDGELKTPVENLA